MRKKTAGFIVFVAAGLIMLSGLASAFMPLMEAEEREAVTQAIEDGDYEAWKNAIESTLTEENFNKLVEKHKNREAIRQAIEDGDYEAWKNAIESTLTEENFNKLVEKHDCMPMKNGKMPFKGGRIGSGIPGSRFI